MKVIVLALCVVICGCANIERIKLSKGGDECQPGYEGYDGCNYFSCNYLGYIAKSTRVTCGDFKPIRCDDGATWPSGKMDCRCDGGLVKCITNETDP